jgi:hypothetical protein
MVMLRSTQIRHRLDIDSTIYHCYVYIVATLVERVIADQLRIARIGQQGSSEPEDRSHVQRSDGDVFRELYGRPAGIW